MKTRIFVPAGLILSASLIFSVTPIQADHTIVLKNKTNGNVSTFQVKGKMARMSSGHEPGYTVYDRTRNILIYVDDQKQAYSEIDLKMVREQVKLASQQMAQMRTQIASMPPEQRYLLEQQLQTINANSGTTVSHRTTGNRKISGYQCKAYDLLMAGRRVSEVCLANATTVGIGRPEYETLMAMMGFMQEMARLTRKISGSIAEQNPIMLSDLKGIPVAMRNFTDGSEHTIASLSPAAINKEVFTAYRSYRKRPMHSLDQ